MSKMVIFAVIDRVVCGIRSANQPAQFVFIRVVFSY